MAFWGFLLLVSVLALSGLLIHTQSIPWRDGFGFGLMVILAVVSRLRSIELGKRISFSLSLLLVLPALFIYGYGVAMWLVIFHTLTKNLIEKKKTWDITLFNVAQLTLSVWITGIGFEWAGGTFGQIRMPQDLAALFFAGMLYTTCNLGFVTRMDTLRKGQSWWTALRILSTDGLVNYALLIYLGIVFALFIQAWGIWGTILFYALLSGFAELLQVGIRMDEEQILRKSMEQELLLDPKTGVFNFRYMNQWLTDRDREPTALLFIDIDDFKLFNDHYGHERGDAALKRVAEELAASTRANDKVIRFGGEEFVVILPNMGRQGAQNVAKRIQERLALIPEATLEYPVTVSIGLATYPSDTQDEYELLRMADLAMYQAKSRGKNQSCYWRPDLFKEVASSQDLT